MRRRVVIVVVCCVAIAGSLLTVARAAPPTPELNFATTVIKSPCTAADDIESAFTRREEYYPGACQRLKFTFGPIPVKPGQNDVLVEPVVIEKPAYDGYITRFKPDLVRVDGTVPPIEQIHLHHATWLSVPEYGTGPFFAAGEEKTLATFPEGYGMPVKATDTWLLLYMIHSAVAQPDVVYITYEIDYIPKKQGDALGIQPVHPVWLDVRPSSYPVFNVQRSFGGGDGTCTWPKERCADFDPWGKVIPGQGAPPDTPGTDWRLPARGSKFAWTESFQGGTLIGIGGHLHPGGLTNDIDLVRNGQSQRIYTAQAQYWDRTDSTTGGGPPTSWDFSMKVTGLPRWGVRLEPGDILRSNATYDTTYQSTYENMGIAVALLAPDKPDGTPTAPGLNPFAVPFDGSDSCESGGLEAATPTLCDKGMITHGHLAENDNFGGPSGDTTLAGGNWRFGPVSGVDIAAFLYTPGDLSMLSMSGIPQVSRGQALRFTNEDTFLDVYHSVTSCKYPCTGRTGTAFPLGNGATSTGRVIDFDSGELGYGIPTITAAKQEMSWNLDTRTFSPGEVVTYYCRIHPFMRGAFEVVG